jgi:hypothetical protein
MEPGGEHLNDRLILASGNRVREVLISGGLAKGRDNGGFH